MFFKFRFLSIFMLISRNEKSLDTILLKLHTFLINERSSDKIVSKVLQIFTYLCEKPIFARKIYRILFNTESLVKKTKQLLKIFNDMNLNYEDLLKKILQLSKFSFDSGKYFPVLCKFFISFLNVSVLCFLFSY